MELPNILMLGALVALVIAIIWGGYLWSRQGSGAKHEDFSADFFIGLGRGLGLERYTEREYFGERIQVLSGQFRDVVVELEVSSGDWAPYLRVVVDFPSALAQDVNVFSQNRSGVLSLVQQVREVDVGDDDFDRNFVIYAPNSDVLERLLPESTRYQMIRILENVDELRLTDESLFVFVEHPVTREEVKTLLKKSVDLGDRIYSTADRIGPRSPERTAAHYEQATMETVMRTSLSETAEESDSTSGG